MDSFIPNNSSGNIPTWGLAIILAFGIHFSFFLSVKTPDLRVEPKEHIQQGISINLKKLLPTPAAPKPKVEAQPKPQAKPKLKPKPQPIIKPKPIIQPEHKAVIEPEPEPAPQSETVETKVIETQDTQTEIFDQTNTEQASQAKSHEQTPTSNSGNPDIQASYESTLITWLARFKRYPNSAKRRGQEDTIEIEFTIDKDGNVLSHRFIHESNYISLNKAVSRMVKQSSPLPPVPIDIQGNKTTFTFIVPVVFKLRN